MSILPWSDMLSVGVKAIDRQHQTLIDILNQFGEQVDKRAGDWEESVTLSRLVAYTETHFAFEEALMRKAGYPGMEDHVEEHRQLFQQVADIMTRVTSGEKPDPQELMIFLRDWLSTHILVTDKALGAALNGRGIT
jgi:hemerythrin-like metal-binding protein